MRRWLMILSLAAGVFPVGTLEAQDDPRWAEAESRYGEAERLYEATNYDGALAEFSHIYELLEGHPRRFFVLFNIGRCQERLFHYDEAITSYERYLQEGRAHARAAGERLDREAEANQTLNALRQRLATLSIATNVDRAEVWIDERMVGYAPGDVSVVEGRHAVQLRAHGHAPAQQDVQIAARTTQQLSFTLDATFAGLPPAIFISTAAATGAALVVGVAFGAMALAEQANIDSQLGSSDPMERFRVTQAQIDANAQTALIADIMFGVTGALGIATIVLMVMTDWSGEDGSAESANVALLPWASADSAGLVLGGSF